MSKFAPPTLRKPVGAPDWMDEVIAALNGQNVALRDVLRALNFSENFQAEVRELMVTGPSWQWIAPTLSNSWANYGAGFETAGYSVEPGGRVWLRGLLKSGTVAAGATGTQFTLPSGYRPELDFPVRVACNNVGTNDAGTAWIRASGAVQAESGFNSWWSLSNISFQAVATAALPTPPSWPQGAPTIQLAQTMTKVVGVVPLAFRALDATNETSIGMGMPSIEWEQVPPRAVKLRTIWGLTPGRRYSLRLLLIGG